MSLWTQIEAEIDRFEVEQRELPVHPQVSPQEVRRVLESRFNFEQPVLLEEVMQEVMGLLRKWTTHMTHPRYFGLFNPSVRQAGIVADTLTALYNPQLAAWSHAPAANEIERLTLYHFMHLIGWEPDSAIANYTSGGAEANLSAVLAAIAYHFPETSTRGIASLAEHPAIYLTSESHHSFIKIARMTGLGTNALHEVQTTENFLMDSSALAALLRADRNKGWLPLMVVGTAGTTGAGLVDPLPQLAEICARFGAWFHVDAAWGGSAIISPQLRPLLAGIERADSVTWDAHKWLSVPMGAGMFFCRHPQAVQRAFAVSTSYMPAGPNGEEAVDPYTSTVQWSRRLIGLKVFMALAELGSLGYASLIERQAQMGELIRARLVDAGWSIANKTQLPVICFTHPDIRSGRISTADILGTIYSRNRVWISEVVLGGSERVLRACVTSYHTNEADIACLVEELEIARQAGLPDQINS